MSKRPAGFKTQEEYNNYMREYKAKRRTENLKHEVELILAHTKLSTEDSQQVQLLIAKEKYFEARNFILLIHNQIREKNEFAINQEKQELINKYLRSDPAYQQMTPEGQHYWELILSKHLDLLITVITQGQYLIRDVDSELYQKLRINAKGNSEQTGLEILNDLLQWFTERMNANPGKLKHAPKFNLPSIGIQKENSNAESKKECPSEKKSL
jgi:hypothetical protein